jgi:predicted CoA-binding protein
LSQPTIAIVGASSNRRKFGNKAVRAYLAKGYQVFPVNLREHFIEGVPTYLTVRDIPVTELDRISVYLPPETVLSVLPDLVHKPAREIWLNPGSDNREVIARAHALGLPVIQGCSILAVGVNPDSLSE